MYLLTAEEAFPHVKNLDEGVIGDTRRELVDDPNCGAPLRVYLALTNGELGKELTAEDRFYNRYYWYLRFARIYLKQFGYDAGIHQMADQILEYPGCDIDFEEIPRIWELVGYYAGKFKDDY